MAAVASISVLAGTVAVESATAPPAAAAAAPTATASKPDVTERPDAVSAALTARLEGHRIEITDARTGSTTTYANPDGTYTLDSYTAPIRVSRGDGWVPLDTTLHADGSTITPAAVPGDVRFTAGGDGPLASVTGSGRSLSYGWAAKLPAPTLSGPTATYPNVVPNGDLLLTATRTGFELSLRLTKAPSAPVVLRLPLTSKGFGVSQTADGTLVLHDAKGKPVGFVPTARMWDSTVDPATGDPAHQSVVSTKLVSPAGGGQELDITPDNAFLTDPSTRYPVTIDPTTTLGVAADTYIESDHTSSDYTSTELRSGYTVNASNVAVKARSLVKFDTSSIAGKHILSASLNLYQTFAPNCTATEVRVYPVTGNWDQTTMAWGNQPPFDSSSYATKTFAAGASGCPATTVTWNSTAMTTMVANWASGATPNYGFMVTPTAFTDTNTWKKYASSQASANIPALSVTYNSIPTAPANRGITPCSSACSNPVSTNAAQPTLWAQSNDADGGNLTYRFQVYQGTNPSPATDTPVADGTTPAYPQGTRISWQLPTALPQGTYSYRVQAADGTDYSAWSSTLSPAWWSFTVDTTPPAVPTVTSTATENDWSNPTTGSFTWSDPDAARYAAWMDSDPQPSPSTATSYSYDLLGGWHTFHVQALDAAGNTSEYDYQFGVGKVSLDEPDDQARTATTFKLLATADRGLTDPRFQYRVGTSATWADIPTTDGTGHALVTDDDANNTVVSWPTTVHDVSTHSEMTDTLTWRVADALKLDGLVQVRVCFADPNGQGGPRCSDPHTVTLDRLGAGSDFASADVGPGTVGLQTGNFAVSGTDASVPSPVAPLTVSRTFNSLAPSAPSILGPGWTSSLPAVADTSDYQSLTDHPADGYVTVALTDGSQYTFTAAATGYQADGPAVPPDLTLAKPGSNSFTLTDGAGTTVTFTNQAGDTYTPTSVSQPGNGGTTTTILDPANGDRLATVVAGPPGVDCTTAPLATVGCHALVLHYANTTTATGATSDPADWGDYAGQISTVSYVAADPQQANAMTSVDVAAYSYDSNGRLRAGWDPRISPALKTTYAYTGDGQIATVTPPGQSGWTLTYDNNKRLSQVSRPDPANGPASSTVVYGVPLSGTGLPDLTVEADGSTQSWLHQSDPANPDAPAPDLPVTGVAVFPPDHTPAGTTADTVASADWQHAQISYLDDSGREVNTAGYANNAWQVATTSYDAYGNTTLTLGPQARDEALNPGATADPAVRAQANSWDRAQRLATISTYAGDGIELTDALGPIHPVQLQDSSGAADARNHTHYTYDEGAPNGDADPDGTPYRLVTTTTVSAQTTDGVDHDTTTSHTGYDPIDGASVTGPTGGWTLRQPTSTTTVMGNGQPDIVHKTRYDAQGRTVETRMPSDPDGTGAGTTLTAYYSADNTAGDSCANHPELAGLVCTTGPKAQPSIGPPLPTTTYTYNLYGQPLTAAETAGSATRTTTISYDAVGRTLTSQVSDTDGGAALPTVSYGYDSATGMPTTVSAGGATVITGYDGAGRVSSYTDGSGDTTTTSYDIDSRPATVTDGFTGATTSYGYDPTSGQLTSLSDSAVGTFTGSYDADGRLVSQTYPTGLNATSSYDEAGHPTQLVYAQNGTTWYTFKDTYTIDDQVKASTTAGGTTTYTYDNAGRLTTAADVHNGSCQTRTYSYNVNSDRLSLATANTPAGDTSCADATTPTTVSHSYDTADRITDPGYACDAFGRTTTVPSADAGGTGGLTLGYYANDLVHTEAIPDGHTKTYSLDPTQQRLATETDSLSGITTTSHYAGSGDSASILATSGGTAAAGWTRNVEGMGGNLAATITDTGITTLQLTNLHGDVVATADTSGTGTSNYFESTEFGLARPDNSYTPDTYGWLGGPRRSADSLGGLVLMGVRLYNPATGRFLSVDPVSGGSANAYDYAAQSPVSNYDLDGAAVVSPGGGKGRWVLSWHWQTIVNLLLRGDVGFYLHVIGDIRIGIRDLSFHFGTYDIYADGAGATKHRSWANYPGQMHYVVFDYINDQYGWLIRIGWTPAPFYEATKWAEASAYASERYYTTIAKRVWTKRWVAS